MADSHTRYGQVLEGAAHDIVDAYLLNAADSRLAGRAAREVTVWLAGLYGRDAVRDLAERLAAMTAERLREHAREGADPL